MTTDNNPLELKTAKCYRCSLPVEFNIEVPITGFIVLQAHCSCGFVMTSYKHKASEKQSEFNEMIKKQKKDT